MIIFCIFSCHLGGATVWPFAGISIFPDKGDGFVWYNLFRNGDPDIFTHHSACPVLLGSKWIANKWIGYNAQWETARCSLSEEALFHHANIWHVLLKLSHDINILKQELCNHWIYLHINTEGGAFSIWAKYLFHVHK